MLPRLSITSGDIIPVLYLKRATVVCIVFRHGLRIEARCTDQHTYILRVK